MEEEDNIIVKWAQEGVETSYKLLNNNKYIEMHGQQNIKIQVVKVLNRQL